MNFSSGAKIVIISFFLALFALSLVIAEQVFGEQGKIIMYNDDGTVEKVETFGYIPDKRPYRKPTVITNKTIEKEPDTTAPAPPTGGHIVEEPQNFEDGWKKKSYKDMTKKERAVWRKMTKRSGRTRKVTKIESYSENGRQVTTIHRNEKDKRGQRWKTKETMYDNRFPARTAQERRKASDEAPQPIRTFEERKVP